MSRLVIDICCNGRVCDECRYCKLINMSPKFCLLFQEVLEENGDGEPLRGGDCMNAESNIPDHIAADYKEN